MKHRPGTKPRAAAGESGSAVTIGVTSFADTLEPTEQYFSWVVSRYGVGETLVRFDETGALTPCLAESWSVSDDHLTWTFRIREGVRFSNGDDMTPDLVKASLERTFAMSDRAATFFEPAAITVNGQDLSITTTEPIAILPGSLADPLFLIVNTNVDDSTFATQGPVCTGPYAVESFSPTESCVGGAQRILLGRRGAARPRDPAVRGRSDHALDGAADGRDRHRLQPQNRKRG